MDAGEAASAARVLLAAADPAAPAATADALRELWLRGVRPAAPGMARDWGFDAPGYEAAGTPVPILEAIGQEAGRLARRRVPEFLPLAEHLWDRYGREGRIVAAVALGPMELAAPDVIVPVLYRLAHTCVFWEDCDQLAMRAVEPVLRRDPATWLEPMGRWVTDENKWVRRVGLTVVGRLTMKRPAFAARCVELLAPALGDPDMDVKRALSFGLRVTARAQVGPLKAFIRGQQGRTDADSLWVLCDVVRSMTRALLPQLADLLPVYRAWLANAEPAARRSVEGAIRVLTQE